MKALNTGLWSICYAKAPPIILITVSVRNTRGRKKPFSTLLILSFTLATSTLVLRGILVLVRRILNSGTLKVQQIDQRVHRDILFRCTHALIFSQTIFVFCEQKIHFVNLLCPNFKWIKLKLLIGVITCSVVLSSRPRISACHLHKGKSKSLNR